MANNKRRKNIFNSLTTLFFSIAVALLGVLVLGLENYQPNEPASIQHNTLQLNQEYVSNPYVVVGDKVYTYAELTASQADSPSSQMSAGGGYKIWFDESNKLELVFYQETSTITQSVSDDSNLSTIALEDSNIASKLQAIKNDDGSIDITIIDPTDIVYISTSGDAEYTLYGLAFGTNTVLNYDDGFYIGEKRSPVSFSAVSTIKEAQLLKISRGNFSFNGEKTYKPNSQQEGRAFLVLGGNLTLNQITLDGFGCSDENYNGGAVYIETGTLNLNCNIGNCYATNGGAVAMNDGTLAINGGVYAYNTATQNGGVIYYLDENALTISDGTFSNNSATNGGVVYAETNITVADGTFSENSATNGGVVYAETNITVADGTFSNNSATNGGVLYGGYTLDDVENIENTLIKFNRTLAKPTFTSVGVEFGIVVNGQTYTGNTISVIEETDDGDSIIYLALGIVDDGETQFQPVYIFSDTSGEMGTGWLSDSDTDYYDYFSTITITKDPNNSEFTSWIKANAKKCVDGKTVIKGGSFLGNTSSVGVIYSTGDTIISSGMQQTSFSQNYGLCGLIYAAGNVTISGGETLPNFTGNYGDARVFVVGANLTINNGEFVSNGAGGGLLFTGSVFNVSGNTVVYDGVFDGNGGEDSVIECVGDVTIYGGQFINSHSLAYGTESAHVSGDGAVVVSKGTVTILGGEFSNNSTGSGGKGGVIKTIDDGDVIISGGTFSGNSANMGGVIYTQNGNITISAGTFSDNYASIATHMYDDDTAPGFGGVIYSVGGNVTITGGTFTGNHANFSTGDQGGYGGVVYSSTGIVNISGGDFSSNSANSGAVVYSAGAVSIQDCTFSQNSATTDGGVAYTEGLLTISNCTFSGNSAEYGAVAYTTNALTLSDCVIENNEFSYSAFHCLNGDYAVSIINSTFKNNVSSSGAIIAISGEKLEDNTIATRVVDISNCLFCENHADTAVICVGYSTTNITDCSFLFNYEIMIKSENSNVSVKNSDADNNTITTNSNNILGTWVLNKSIDLSVAKTFAIDYSLIAGATGCTQLGIGTAISDGNVGLWYATDDPMLLLAYDENGELSLDYASYVCIITITGGADATNADLLAWLQANGTKLLDSVLKDYGAFVPNVFLGNRACIAYVESGNLEFIGQNCVDNVNEIGLAVVYGDATISKCNFVGETVIVYEIVSEISENGMTVSDCQFLNCWQYADDYGLITYGWGMVATITNCKFENNEIAHSIIYIKDTVVPEDDEGDYVNIISNCEFINNTSKLFLVYAEDVNSIMFDNCSFENNDLTTMDLSENVLLGLGGDSVTATIKDCKFVENVAYYSMIYCYNSRALTISGGEFTNNVGGMGGVVCAADGGNVTILGGTFTNNVGYLGGVVYSLGDVTISGGTFSGNSATYDADIDDSGYGGVIYSKGNVIIENGTFENNTSLMGGVVYSIGDVIISGGTFSGNSATYSSSSDEDVGNGGVICANVVNISGGEFTQNTGLRGGVICANVVNISGGEFTNNSGLRGGVVYGDCNYSSITDITDGQIKLKQTLTQPTFTSVDVEFEVVSSMTLGLGKGKKISLIEEDEVVYLCLVLIDGEETLDGSTQIYKWYIDKNGDEVGEWIDDETREYLSIIKIITDPGSDEFSEWIKANAKKAVLANLTISDGIFSQNSADVNGGVVHSVGDVTFSGGTFEENTTSVYGGICFAGYVTVDGGVFNNNTATIGGVILATGVIIEQGEGNAPSFSSNSAFGGGVICAGAITISAGTFTNNSATLLGVVYSFGDLVISGGVFSSNSAQLDGGIGGVLGNGTVTISGGEFTNNSAGRDGGVICISDDDCSVEIIITGGTFVGNTAEGKGGVVYIAGDNIALSITGGEFSNNSATYGSVAYSKDGNVTITGGTFDGTYYLVYINSGDLTISGGEFKNSTTAIYAPNGLTLGNATFEGNETDIYLGDSGYISLTMALECDLVVYKEGITNFDDGDVATGYIAYSTNRQILESAEEYITVSNILDGCELDIDVLENYLVCVTKEIYGIYDISTGKLVHKWRKMIKTGDVVLNENTLVLVNKSYAGRMVVSPVVTTIGTGAFVDSMLSEIYLPDSVSTIQDDAFATNGGVINSLKTLKIGANISNIGNMNLPSLTTLYLTDLTAWCEAPKGTIYLPITNLYVGDTLANDLVIPANTTSIYGQSFRGMIAITSVSIPASVTQIGELAFDLTLNNTSFAVDSENANYASNNDVLFDKNLTTLIAYPLARGSNYTLPTQTTSIANYAFNYASNILSLTFNSLLASVGDYAFACLNTIAGSAINISLPNSLTSLGVGSFFSAKIADVTLGTGLEKIEVSAFRNSTITSINLENITTVGGQSFEDCSLLGGTLHIADGTTIHLGAFDGCESLESVVFDGTPVEICEKAFRGCSNIVEYNFKNCTGIPTLANVNSLEGINDNCKIYVPTSLYVQWVNSKNWSEYESYIVKPVTTITFDANGGTLNHAQTMQVEYGSALALPTLIDSTKAPSYNIGYISIGYTYINNIEDLENLSSYLLFDGNGNAVSGITGYTSADGAWICLDEELTLYAVWQRASAYLLKDWKTKLTSANSSYSSSSIASIIFTDTEPSGSDYTKISVGASDEAGETTYSVSAFGVVDITAYVKASTTSGKYDVIFFSTGIIYAPTNSNSLFESLSGCVSIDFGEHFDTSNVTDMSDMFYYCLKLTSLDVSNFNTRNVTDMSDMFCSCSSLTSLDVSNFNTRNVTDMSYMFRSCSSLTSLDVSNFDTSKVRYMDGMFYNCSSLTSLDLSSFNTSSVKNMSYMFYECYDLTNITFGENFDTSNVTTMGSMFYNCSSLTSLDVSKFDTSNVTNMSYMFRSCSSLTSLDVSNFNTRNVTDMSYMFRSCSSLTSLDVSNFDTSKVRYMDGMFYNCSSLTSLDLSSFNTSSVKNMSYMFYECYDLTNITFGENFDTSNVTTMGSMFYNCSSLTSLDVSKFDTSNVTNMSYMFRSCSSLTSLDVTNFDTSGITTYLQSGMSGMFYNCSSLTSLNLSNFTTSSVTEMSKMFYNCSSLISLDLSNFDTNNVAYMGSMFYNCSSLETLNISNFKVLSSLSLRYDSSDMKPTSVNVDVSDMFSGCTALKTLYAPSSIASGKSISLPVTPMYYFDGANVASTSTLTSTQAGKTLYSTYSTVTFVVSGGSSSPASKKVLLGEKYGTLPSITVNSAFGYTVNIDGWYTESTGGKKVDASTIVSTAGDHKLYAHYTTTENSYNISYDLADGTAGSSAPIKAKYTDVVQISNPTRSGYIFAGWTITGVDATYAKYGNSSSSITTTLADGATGITAQYFTKLNYNDGGTVTFTAVWVAETSYEITYSCLPDGSVAYCSTIYLIVDDVKYTADSMTFTCNANSVIKVVAENLKQCYGSDVYGIAIVDGSYTYNLNYGYNGIGSGEHGVTLSTSEIINNADSTLYVGLYHNDSYIFYGMTTYSVSIIDADQLWGNYANNTITATYSVGSKTESLTSYSGIQLYKRDGDNNLYINKSFSNDYKITKLAVSYDGFTCSKITSSGFSSDTDVLSINNPTYTGTSDKTYYPVIEQNYDAMTVNVLEDGVLKYASTSGSIQGKTLLIELACGYCSIFLTEDPVDSAATRDNRIYYSTFLSEFSVKIQNNNYADQSETYYSEGLSGTDYVCYWVAGESFTINITSGLTTSATSLGNVELDDSPMMGSLGIVNDFGNINLKPSASACSGSVWGSLTTDVSSVNKSNVGLASISVDQAGLFDNSGNLVMSWQELIDNGKITITNNIISGSDSNISGKLVIPDGIVGIKSYAFASCKNLTGITIPASVVDIEYYALYCCENIESIVVDSENSVYKSINNCLIRISDNTLISGCKASRIPSSVTKIGIGAFYGITTLESIDIPEGVETIDYFAFCGCTGLESVVLPDSITTIGNWAFEKCSNLVSVTFGAELVDIQMGAFAYCSSVIEYNFINCQNIPSLANYAFEGINSLCVIRISSNLYSDWQDAQEWLGLALYMVEFKQYGLVELSTGELMISFENMVEAGWLLFSENDDGTVSFDGVEDEVIYEIWEASINYNFNFTFKFVMPESIFGCPITSISQNAFDLRYRLLVSDNPIFHIENVSFIKQIELPARLQKIENYAFSGVNYLDNIQIPASVVEIEPYAFYNCLSLTRISVAKRNENYCSENGVVFDKNKETLVAVPANKSGTYSIPASVKTIGAGAFAYSGLSHIDIPTSIEHISAMAFAYCSGIALYDFRDFTTIPTLDGEGEFEGIKNSTLIYVPTSLYSSWRTADGWRNWRGNIYADNIVLDAGLYDSFTGDLVYSWAELISNNIISVEDNCITGSNSKLLNGRLIMSNDITIIGGGAFAGCNGLTAVTLSSNLTAIGEGAFYMCNFVEKIIIPAKVSTIGECAFTGCANLTKLEVVSGNSNFVAVDNVLFDSSMSTLIYYANGKSGSYTIPGTVDIIAPYAFAYSCNLSKLNIPNSVTQIGDYGIAYCTGLGYLEIPASITVIEAHTFVGNSNIKEYSFRNHTSIPELKSSKAFGDYEIESELDIDFYAFFVIYVPATLYNEWLETGNWAEFVSGWDESMGVNRIMTTEPVEIDKSVPGFYSMATGLLVLSWEECISEGLIDVDDNQITAIAEDIGVEYYLVIAEGITAIGNAVGTGDDFVLGGIHFPSTLKSIGTLCFVMCTITEFNIPASCTSIGDFSFMSNPYCTAINVEEGNPVYSSENGVLFNKNKTKLLIYPAGKGGTYVVPDTVVEIGSCAFLYSMYLQRVILPSSVAIIGDEAFFESGISEIVMSNNVTEIGKYAFGFCANLTSVRFGDRLTTIGNYAFAECEGLTTIELPDSLTTVGESAFRGCDNLSGTINLYGVQYISNYAFMGLTNITQVIWGDNLISIGEQAFDGCTNLTGDLVITDSCINIGQAAFRNTGFTSLLLGSGITRIESYTFQNCASLQSITLGTNLTYLGNFAFAGCSAMSGSVVLADSITTIAEAVFKDCSSLSSIIFGNNITSIGEYAFSNCSNWSGVINLPTTLVSIGKNAFNGCAKLTGEVILSDSVTQLGDFAFAGCAGITKVVFGSGLTSVGNQAFYGCASLASVEFSSNITSIGISAFNGCTGLTGKLILPSGLTTISDYAFQNCTGLIGVDLGNSLVTIGDLAFYGCTNLAGSLILPTTLVSIGQSAFRNNKKLTGTLTIGDNVTTIGDFAFHSATGITQFVFGKNIQTIGAGAFASCSACTIYNFENCVYVPFLANNNAFKNYNTNCMIYVPASLYNSWVASANWSEYAPIIECHDTTGIFDANGNMITSWKRLVHNGSITVSGTTISQVDSSLAGILIIPSKFKTIGANAFASCTSISAIVLPQKLATIEAGAFSGCSFDKVYYNGTHEKWESVSVGESNGAISNATIYYYITPSTCTHNENYHYWFFDDDYKISLVDVTVENWQTTQEPTCTAYGTREGTCLYCGEHIVELIDVLDHDYVDGTCSVCGSVETLYTITNDSSYPWTINSSGELISGNYNVNSSSSTYIITANTDLVVTFSYKVSSESSYDKFTITKNSTTLVNAISGSTSYASKTVNMVAGDVLKFVYSKDGSINKNNDRAYIKNLVIGYAITVTLDANGGICDTASLSVNANGTYGTLPTATKDGLVLDGWYTHPVAGEKVTADTVVSRIFDHTLYAHYKIADGYLSSDWKTKLTNANSNYSSANIASIKFTNVIPSGSEYTKVSVGTNTSSTGVADVTAYIKASSTSGKYDIIFFCAGTIYAPTDSRLLFSSLTNCASIDFGENFDTSNVTDMSDMFYKCYDLTNITFGENFDTSSVTDMSYMFYYCESLTSLNLSNFDTSNVTDMGYMFYYCQSLTSLNLSNFDTSSVTDMSYMFYYCQSLTSLNLSSFNTSNVTNMSYMFAYCSSLTSLNLSNFDTSSVTDMSYMFEYCNRLTDLSLSNFDTSNVTNMSHMFYDCSSLETLNISNFTISSSVNVSYMFSGCSAVTHLIMQNFTVGASASRSRLFTSLTNLKTVDMRGLSVGDSANISYWFYGSIEDVNMSNAVIGASVNLFSLFTSRDYSYLTTVNLTGIDTSRATSLEGMFYSCYNLTSLDLSSFNTSSVTNMSHMFYRCYDLTSLDLSSFDTSNVTNMSYMFYECYDLTNITFGENFDTSSVTDMSYMFRSCSSLTSLDLSNFDTSNVTDMSDMFYNCSSLVDLDLSGFVVNNDAKLNYIFSGCSSLSVASLQTLDVSNKTDLSYFLAGLSRSSINMSGFDFSSATNLSYLFENSSLKSIDFGNLDTSSVTNMSSMFRSCYNLTSLDLSSFDTSNVTNMSYMFYECYDLTNITFGENFDTSSVTDMSYMFYECRDLTNITFGENFDTSSVTDMSYMFRSCSSLTSLDLSNFDTSNVTGMSDMFFYCPKLTSLDVSNFDTSKVTDMSYMFRSCSSLTSLDLSSFDTSSVTNMSFMFYSCQSLTSLNLSSFNTSNVTNMSDMFYYCPSLTSLNLSNFDTSNVTNMSDMFYYCQSLTSLNLSSFNTSNVTNMSYMFAYCSSLTSLNLSNFDTSNVTNMSDMFAYCSSLTSLNLSNFDTSNVTNMRYMFYDCSSLETLNISNFTISSSASVGSMFSGCTSLITIYAPKTINKTISLPVTLYYDNNGTSTSTSSLTSAVAGKTLQRKSIMITFDANGGACDTQTITKYSGIKYGELPVPTRAGYNFVGWYTDAEDGTKVTSSTTINSTTDFTLYAHWIDENIHYVVENDATYPWTSNSSGELISGNYNISSSSSTLIITAYVDMVVTFSFKVSSESSCDKFTITKNSTTLVNAISGSTSYASKTVNMVAGDVLKFVYSKDSSVNKNNDRAYIKNLVVDGVTIELEASSVSTASVENLTITQNNENDLSAVSVMVIDEEDENSIASTAHVWLDDKFRKLQEKQDTVVDFDGVKFDA